MVPNRTRGLAVVSFAALTIPAIADVELPAVLESGMVLQRDMPVPIWGKADPGEHVVVTLGDQRHETTADENGAWLVRLDPMPAGGPHRVHVRGNNAIVLEDVLVGEVWLGAGQSNMRMTVAGCDGFESEREHADLPAIRMFRATSSGSNEREWRGAGNWVVCGRDTVGQFSGILFFFGRELHAELGVPIGLVDTSLGGMPIESWISAEAQYAHPELVAYVTGLDASFAAFDAVETAASSRSSRAAWNEEVQRSLSEGRKPPKRPPNAAERILRAGPVGYLFNGMIAPLVPFAIRGVLWYQGEANVPNAGFYRYQLPTLIRDWREHWGQGDFPFLWVQLPNIQALRDDADWPGVREAMRRTLALPNTGMAVTIDIGDPHKLHPTNKQDFARRLTHWPLTRLYGRAGAASGPLVECFEVRGRAVIVRFDQTEGGLVARDGDPRCFEIADGDGVWHAACARIFGKDAVTAFAEGVERPTAVRYAWSDNPPANLYNGAGLPASPFTTAERY